MPAVVVDRVSKRYRLGREHYGTLRGALSTAFGRKREERGEVWALRDLSLELAEGEALGIVGRNGAGKSTLLRILARITEPTAGETRVRGRVGALLEVGTGFHPELTGTENVFLNGALLGMSRRDVQARFDDIVEFAGVGRFLETPLKRYSSGMQLRLAFAVAAHLEPEVVVIDEVLAVGDAEFQERCLGRLASFRAEGRTLLFVSHDLGAIGRLCRRAVWLDAGGAKADGPAADVIDRYLRSATAGGAVTRTFDAVDAAVQPLTVELVDEDGAPVELPRRDRPLRVRLRFRTAEPVPGLDVALVVHDTRGVRVLDETWSDTPGAAAFRDAGLPGTYVTTLTIPPVLPAGRYVAAVWFGRGAEEIGYHDALEFRLWPAADEPQQSVRRDRLVQPPVEWTLDRVGEADAWRLR
jgi:ABC-2 type transport system ATP-binding protein/lipopolysaccharide transport system ATP-binding protein